jgi:hypothetical protein
MTVCCCCRANFESLLGPLLPQLEAAAKNYSGYRPNKQGVQVSKRDTHHGLLTCWPAGLLACTDYAICTQLVCSCIEPKICLMPAGRC